MSMKEKKLLSEKLRTENKKMELRLQQLKLAMSKEKEDRLSNGNQSSFWTSGSPGAVLNYRTNLPEIDPTKKVKFKLLKDEPSPIFNPIATMTKPQDIIIDDNDIDDAYESELSSVRENGYYSSPRCGQCEENKAAVNCKECSEVYCPKCFAAFHLKGALRKHRSIPISASGHRISIPTSLFKPPDLSNDVVETIKKPNTSSKTLKGAKENRQVSRETVVSSNITEEYQFTNSIHQSNGPQLTEGRFDEEFSRQYFQEALDAWRNGVEAAPPSKPRTETVTTETSFTDGQRDYSDEIKFTPSLSYAEQLLLRKHRNNQLAAVDMKFILNRLSSSNNKEMFENKRLMESYLDVEKSLQQNSTAIAVDNMYHLDISAITALWSQISSVSNLQFDELKNNMPMSSFVAEEMEIPVEATKKPHESKETVAEMKSDVVNNGMRDTASDENSENFKLEFNEIKPVNGHNRSKSSNHGRIFNDRPHSSRRMSARSARGGKITTKPSDLLNILADFSNYLPDNGDSTIPSNLKPRPASTNSSKSSKKISYNFYKLTPKSWKPTQAWTNDLVLSKDMNTFVNSVDENDYVCEDKEMEAELGKLNTLTNVPQLAERLRISTPSKAYISDGTENNPKTRYNDVDDYNGDSNSDHFEDENQLETLQRELTAITSNNNFYNSNALDEIVADSLEINDPNPFAVSFDSDKFYFVDSLDFANRNSHDFLAQGDQNDDEEMGISSSRFDDYDDVHNLN